MRPGEKPMKSEDSKVENSDLTFPHDHGKTADLFCSRCGTRTPNEQIMPQTCESCGNVRYQEAKVAVTTAVYSGNRLLLVKRRYPPEQGKWSLPGGYLNPREDPALAAARETMEETGLKVGRCKLLDVLYNPEQGGADITIVYLGTPSGGLLEAGDDAEEAAFFQIDRLPTLAFSSTHQIVKHLKRAAHETN